jgi:hypothetical protein
MRQFIRNIFQRLSDAQIILLILAWGVGLPLLAHTILEGWIAVIAAILGALPWIIMPLYLSSLDKH